MERGHQEVARPAGAIAGEWTAGPVRAVGRRRERDEEDASGRIAEPRNWTAPVALVPERGALLAGDALAIRAQAFAAVARDDGAPDGRKTGHAESSARHPSNEPRGASCVLSTSSSS